MPGKSSAISILCVFWLNTCFARGKNCRIGESGMKSLFRALVAVCAMSMASGVSATVVVGDNIWRQVTDTLGFSWSDFDSVCDTTDGTCAGSLGVVDLTDWIWADTVELQTLLFDTLSSQPTFDPVTFVSPADAPWASEFFELGFSASSSGIADVLSGIVRDQPVDLNVRRVTIQDSSSSIGLFPDILVLENFGTNEILFLE